MLEPGGTGRTMWYRAVRLLRNGGGGTTVGQLINAARTQFPRNADLALVAAALDTPDANPHGAQRPGDRAPDAGASSASLRRSPPPVPSEAEAALREFANGLHRQLTTGMSQHTQTGELQQLGFGSGELDRLVHMAEQVGPEAREAAYAAAQALDAALSALRGPLRQQQPHAEKLAQIERTERAVQAGIDALNRIYYRDYWGGPE